MQSVSTIRDLRLALLKWREAGETVAFVPTMGALHEAHLSLVREAKKSSKRVVASVFVNPLQFGPKEDFKTYPRQLDKDQQLLSEAGCDLLYSPTSDEMYTRDFSTKIDPGPMATILEGAFRPHFFYGVSTVVMKLLLQVMPDIAFFGEKDYQQLLIIQRIVYDLDLPVHIVGLPIVRDTDGLALSSRNAYLSSDERKRAVALPNTLKSCIEKMIKGETVDTALKAGRAQLEAAGFTVDYLELADSQNLLSLKELRAPARLLAAARIGSTRLIDNMAVE
ncbi:MAG: pantoate--beta-alanine ligase [Alphaproteobacteria bacterium]